MTFSSSLSSYFVTQFERSQNGMISSPPSEHELALLGSGYPSLASNAWSRNTFNHADANNGRGMNE